MPRAARRGSRPLSRPCGSVNLHFALPRAIFAGERGADLHEVSGQTPTRGYPQAILYRSAPRRLANLCAADKTIATGGHTHPAGARRTTGVGAQASPWMRRSDAMCGYKSRWTVPVGQQTGSQFNESERGRSRLSGHFSGNLAWRSRSVRPRHDWFRSARACRNRGIRPAPKS
jgi:hypothetical protein